MTTILCIGDVHLGRPVRRLPAGFEDAGILPEELAPGAAFDAAVSCAVSRAVDAVLLAGDVADKDNRYFEAHARLESGVQRLVDAGIPVLAVAGNHDADVLPRLAAQVPGFSLLGAKGTWETLPIERDGRVVARVTGWSFPTGAVTESPLETYPEPEPGPGPLIGLLHGDLDQPGSRYAPVTRRSLQDTNADAWLLGHVHVPGFEAMAAARPIGYLGSLVGLDPTETGPHGPWLLEVRDGRLSMTQLPLAPLRWEQHDVPIDDLESEDDLAPLLVQAINDVHEHIRPTLGEARAVGVRFTLVGRHRRPSDVQARARDFVHEATMWPRDGVAYFIDRIRCDVQPDFDLSIMARGSDPAALLARTLLRLEDPTPTPERTALLAGARRSLEQTIAGRNWSVLGREMTIDDDVVTERLRRAGRKALETLIATRPEAVDALERLDIRRLPGIPDPFDLDDIDPGVTIILGPNAAGKTSICHGVRSLLWPAPDRSTETSIRATWSTAAGRVVVEHEGGRSTWRRDGAVIDPLPLPPPHLNHCYTITIEELLDEQADDSIATQVAKEMAGGFDLTRTLEGFPDRSRGGQRERAAVEQARRTVAERQRRHQSILDRLHTRRRLETERDAAEAARTRLARLEVAGRLGAARAVLDAAERRLAEFPDGLDRLTGNEMKVLARLDDDCDAAAQRLDQSIARGAEARRRHDEACFDVDAPEASKVHEMRARAAELAGLEQRRREQEARRQEAAARRSAAAAALGAAADAGPVANLDRAVLDDVDSFLDDAQRLRQERSLRRAEIEQLEDVSRGPARRAWMPILALVLLALAGAVITALLVHSAGWALAVLVVVAAAWAWPRPATSEIERRSILRTAATRRLAALDEPERALESRRAALSATINVDPGASDLALATLGGRLSAYLDQSADESAAAAHASGLDADMAELIAVINRFLADLGVAAAGDATAAAAALAEIERRHGELKAAARAIETAADDERGAREQVAEKRRHREDFMTELGLGPDDDRELELRLARRDDHASALDAADSARHQVDTYREQLADAPELIDESAETIVHLNEACREQADSYGHLVKLISDIDADVKQAREGRDLETALAGLQEAEDALETGLETALDSAAARFLLDRVQAAHETEAQPRVVQHAAELFARFTRYRFELRVNATPAGGRAFQGLDTETGRRLELDQLSTGTRMQLLLAVRIAFAESLEVGETLPIFLDEVLGSTDPDRYREAMESLLALATDGRQLFYLTCEPSHADRWREAAADAGVTSRTIDLAAVRGRSHGDVPVERYRPPAAPVVPSPQGHAPESYAMAIEAPAFDPRRAAAAMHPYYLLQDDLPLLARLLGHGFESVGPLLAMLDATGPRGPATDAESARLRRRAAIAEAFVRQWRVGRGTPADRAALEASGAVSDKFIDGFAELLVERRHDADALLDEIGRSPAERDDRVKGFLEKKREALEAFLVDAGYVDRQPVLDRTGVVDQVVRSLRGIDDETDYDEIARLCGALWSACGAGDSITEPKPSTPVTP